MMSRGSADSNSPNAKEREPWVPGNGRFSSRVKGTNTLAAKPVFALALCFFRPWFNCGSYRCGRNSSAFFLRRWSSPR
jgi:hypothetical protein